MGENQFSYVKENVGNIVVRILSFENVAPTTIKNYELPINSLLAIKLDNIIFQECHFQNTSLHSSKISNCLFVKCQFDRLEINGSTAFNSVKFLDCEISTLYDAGRDKGFYDRFSIANHLKNKGLIVEISSPCCCWSF